MFNDETLHDFVMISIGSQTRKVKTRILSYTTFFYLHKFAISKLRIITN